MQSTQISAQSKAAGPEGVGIREVELAAAPPAGHVRIRVEASGASYGDLLFQRGVVPGGPKHPFVPGCDLTGIVEAVGAGVDPAQVGGRVTALVVSGGYATVADVPVERVVPVPDGLDPVAVAAVALNYFIAHQMLHRVARVQPGHRVLVHGASGGVGHAFLQLAGHIGGVTVFGTCSASNAAEVRRHGGVPIDYRDDDFVQVVEAAGAELDAAFDPIGGTHFRRSYKLLRRGGQLVAYGQNDALRDGKANMLVGAVGFLGGIVAPKLVPDGRSTVFYNAWSLEKSQPSAYREDMTAVLELLAADKIAPRSVTVEPLTEARRVFRTLEDGVSGKIVLDCSA